MRLCRFQLQQQVSIGFYRDDAVCPLESLAARCGKTLPPISRLIELLPGGEWAELARELNDQLDEQTFAELGLSCADVKFLVPIPDPPKLLLLAGNYAKHVAEGGETAETRENTFPYVFMKPPSTTLTHPGDPIMLPRCSPSQIDWELELGVIIGRQCRDVSEASALDHVAGYTIVNDISDRGFRPNPGRQERPRDRFFDWLHGKWHDTFCPLGPCILSAAEVPDPQSFPLQLSVNGHLEQNASTAEMVFPVAAVISFISQLVTLEPGDIISTGTPDGVGKAKGKFLQVGDLIEAKIGGIGTLVNPVA